MRYRILLRESGDGIVASAIGLPGCRSHGASAEEAVDNVKDAIKKYLACVESETHGAHVREVDIPIGPVDSDAELMAAAQDLVGPMTSSQLFREALRALIERESAKRLAALGGSFPDIQSIPRRRPEPGMRRATAVSALRGT